MAEHAPDTHPQDPHQAAMFEVSNTAGAPQLEVAPEALPPAPEAPVEQPRVKMMFVHGEDKNSKPVHIPRDADKQVEWVNSPYNNFTLDRNQFRALSPEARNAYATAQLQRAQEQAAPTGPRIEDRLGDARADEEAQAKLMAEEARVKAENARDALNGTDKPHAPEPEAQTPVPEPQQKLLADRIDPNQMDRLDALAEGAVINGNREHFDQVAEELGVTEAERQALLDIATKTTATQRAQRHTADQIATQPETPDSSGASGERASSVKLEDLSFSEKIAAADQIMSEGRKAHSAGDHAVANKLEAQMDTIFSSLSPDEQQAFMDRYKPTTLPESTPAPEQSPPEPEQAAPKISPTERLYQDFVAGKLSEADKRVLATSLARRAETAHANGEPVGEMIMRIREVYNTMDDEGKNQFNAQFGPHPSFEPPKPQLTYKESVSRMSFENRRDEAVRNMEMAQRARAAGREDIAQELFDRVHDIYETFTPAEADAWTNFRNANPLAGSAPVPRNANANTSPIESNADRAQRIHNAFVTGNEASLTSEERVELMLALAEAGDNVGANELYYKGLSPEEREAFTQQYSARGNQNGNAAPQPEADDRPEPVTIDVDDFTLMSKSGRYSALNQIADYAHDLMDKDADPRLIDVVWEQFDELYQTLTPKQRREFRNKVSDWEFDDVNVLERLAKNPIKTTKEGTKAVWNKSKDSNSTLRGVEKQRIELGIDANGDWIDMPIRNRAEDENTSEARYLDAGNLRREADSLNRWAHPIKKFRLNAEARNQERAYRVETMEPVALTSRQRRAIGLPQVYGEAVEAVQGSGSRWLSAETKEELARQVNSLYQSENEFDTNQFTGPQYAGTARTLVPGSWRRNRRYIGPGRVTALQQRLNLARQEADYNYSQWRLRQQRAQAGPQGYNGPRRPGPR